MTLEGITASKSVRERVLFLTVRREEGDLVDVKVFRNTPDLFSIASSIVEGDRVVASGRFVSRPGKEPAFHVDAFEADGEAPHESSEDQDWEPSLQDLEARGL